MQERSQGVDVQGRLMEIDGEEDDYDYYESQAARNDRIKARAKYFGTLPEQDLDDNVEIPDSVVVYDKKKNAVYSFDGYTTAVEFGDPEHQHKRNKKKNIIQMLMIWNEQRWRSKYKHQEQKAVLI
ncbi:MAG: hypothetical protein EZS28_005675 [Streblomastix strix]|uniref:Uncharacterized protein n=1 Tax=Streblomastix strix TaxID=222440 RepID=A0A5J4WUZ3_9EUKA|nr:MAG: hypothetical protein EZS28_005674 [Streblomastix strix]KAA6398799.1 MAG: hypothetical protein EZS28_005675 [Streblomastix strix]